MRGAKETHHGTPSPSWPWIWTKVAKMPRIADDATSMNSIHRLSWMAGQWYLWRRSMRRSYTTDESVTEDAIVYIN